MNTGVTIGRRRAFEEDKLGGALTLVNTLMENIILFPLSQNILVDLNKI